VGEIHGVVGAGTADGVKAGVAGKADEGKGIVALRLAVEVLDAQGRVARCTSVMARARSGKRVGRNLRVTSLPRSISTVRTASAESPSMNALTQTRRGLRSVATLPTTTVARGSASGSSRW
jgi:hypothetical protein